MRKRRNEKVTDCKHGRIYVGVNNNNQELRFLTWWLSLALAPAGRPAVGHRGGERALPLDPRLHTETSFYHNVRTIKLRQEKADVEKACVTERGREREASGGEDKVTPAR